MAESNTAPHIAATREPVATIMNDMVKLSEALEQLPISRSTLKRLIQAGKIEGVRIGKQWFIHRDEIGRNKRESTRGGQT